jgi:DNA-binding GntR family transcriptional regulator
MKRSGRNPQHEPRSFSKQRRPQAMIFMKSLREQVYEFLRKELTEGKLLPGSSVNLTEISKQLGISKTPLRDALIQLESEGFVTISPRRGIYVNRLTIDEIRHIYEIVGSLEATALLSTFDRLDKSHTDRMRQLNVAIKNALDKRDYSTYYERNIDFHNVFLELSDNETLRRIVMTMKRRLYDFPRRGYIAEWEENNCEDHARLIEAIEMRDAEGAAGLWRGVHWSFESNEKFIREFYFRDGDQKQLPEKGIREARKGAT